MQLTSNTMLAALPPASSSFSAVPCCTDGSEFEVKNPMGVSVRLDGALE